MSNLSQILADSNWGQESARINQNFQNMNTDLEKVKSATTKFKGYFTTEESLKNKFGSPKIGDTAWVGESYPGTVYDVQTDGQWHNTGKAPDTGSVDLQDYAKKAELTELDTKTEEIYNLLSKSLYYENTLLDASNGTTSFIGKDKSFDCILIPTRGAKKAYIEGLNINSANGICFFENFPEFKGSITGGYITTSTSLPINESRIIDIPNNAKVLGFSIAISSRLDNDTRQKIKLRDLYFEDIVDTKIDTKIEESFSKNNNIQLFKNLRAISDSTKSNSKIEFLPT